MFALGSVLRYCSSNSRTLRFFTRGAAGPASGPRPSSPSSGGGAGPASSSSRPKYQTIRIPSGSGVERPMDEVALESSDRALLAPSMQTPRHYPKKMAIRMKSKRQVPSSRACRCHGDQGLAQGAQRERHTERSAPSAGMAGPASTSSSSSRARLESMPLLAIEMTAES